jgi:LemA protein
MFNKLVRLRNRAENAWAQVDVQLRKRYDLVPNLVETVKGYAAHERGTFEAVTQARTAAQQAQGVQQQAEAENMLTAALGRLFAVAEAYPQLRATENFQQLQAQLSDVEQNIAVSRQVYNDTVLSYDNALETVPTNVIAGIFHFNPREYFQTEEVTRAAPQVSFTDAPPPPAAPPPPETPAPTPPAQTS